MYWASAQEKFIHSSFLEIVDLAQFIFFQFMSNIIWISEGFNPHMETKEDIKGTQTQITINTKSVPLNRKISKLLWEQCEVGLALIGGSVQDSRRIDHKNINLCPQELLWVEMRSKRKETIWIKAHPAFLLGYRAKIIIKWGSTVVFCGLGNW